MFLLMSLLLVSPLLARNMPTHIRAKESGQGSRLYWSHLQDNVMTMCCYSIILTHHLATTRDT